MILRILIFLLITSTAFAVDVGMYEVFELELTDTGSYGNPYLQMPGDNSTPGFVVGTFTGPSSQQIVIDGFWDGGDTWRIRMAPTEVGTWNYTTSSSDGGLNGVSGSFTCVASDSHGFVEVDPTYPHHFRWTDGTHFYWAATAIMIAHHDLRNPQGNSYVPTDSTWADFISTRVAQGFNSTHWGYYGFNKPYFKDGVQHNEGGAPFTGYDPDILNPSYHQYGDLRVQVMIDRGIMPQFILGWPDQDIISLIGHTRLKRYWRYLIARYAAYNLSWNLFGEGYEFGDASILIDYGQLTKAWDPYDHILTIHDPTESVMDDSWMDFITLQSSAGGTGDYLSYGKPVINSEFGAYEVHQVTPDELRVLSWVVKMYGGYFVYESWGDDVTSDGALYSSYINNFFKNDTDYWLLEYHDELFAGGSGGLATPGSQYVIYLSTGGNVTVNLSAVSGSLPYRWYNPRTGTYDASGTIAGGGSELFSAPDSNDWVLYIGSSSVVSTDPVLLFSDLTDGCRSCLTDAVVTNQGVIVTVWGGNLDSGHIYIKDPDGDVHKVAHVYYWGNADGVSGGGPSNISQYLGIQEISFAIPSSADVSSISDPSKIFVIVEGINSNELNFVVKNTGSAYFVSTSGDDGNAGTWASPKRHLFMPSPGDVIYFLTGSDFNIVSDITGMWKISGLTAGSNGNRYGFVAYPGSSPEISSTATGLGNNNEENSYIVFSKIRIKFDDTNNHFEHSRIVGVHYVDYSCQSGQGAIEGSNAYDGMKYFGNHFDALGGTCSSSNQHHTTYFTIRNGGTSEGFEFAYNILNDNQNRIGIHYYDEGSCGKITSDVLWHHNIVINQTSPGFDIQCLNVSNCSGIFRVYNNLFVEVGKNNVLGLFGGQGVFIEDWDADTEIHIYNNTFYGWGFSGCFDESGIDDCAFLALDEYNGSIIWQKNIVVDTHDLTNFYTQRVSQSFSGTGNNVWYNGGDSLPLNPPAWDTDPVTTNPLFVDAGAYNFRLLPGSPVYGLGIGFQYLFEAPLDEELPIVIPSISGMSFQ